MGAPEYEELLARYVLDRLPAEDVPGLAARALEQGCEARPIVLLAGLQAPTRADVDEVLGTSRPTPAAAMKVLVDAEAVKIARGRVNPFDGASAIWRLFGYSADPDERPELWRQIAPFAEACVVREDDAYNAAADDYGDIRAAAATLLERGGLQVP